MIRLTNYDCVPELSFVPLIYFYISYNKSNIWQRGLLSLNMRHTWLDARLLFRQINSRLKYDERRSKEKDESWKCKHLMFVVPQLWTHRKPKNHPFFLLYFSIYLLLSILSPSLPSISFARFYYTSVGFPS